MASRGKQAGWVSIVAQRWKAIAAAGGSLATALLVVFPGNHVLQLVIAVVGALVTGGLTHQVVNAVPALPVVGGAVDAVTGAVGGLLDGVVDDTPGA